MLANAGGGLAAEHGFAQAIQIAQHMHHAFAVLQCLGQSLAQGGFLGGRHVEAGHGQLDVVFLETVDARKALRGQKLTIDTQVGVAARPRPVGQFGVNAFAVADQRGQQANVLALELRHQLGHDAVGGLRLHRCAIACAVLDAQLDVQQAQKVPDLGGGAHRGFAAATRQALLNRHGGRDAIDRIDLGATCGLNDASGIGVQAFQITTLAFVEQDVKRQGGFTGAADACDHVELAAWNVHAQVFEVVLFGVDDLDVVVQHRCAPNFQQRGCGVRG